MFFVDVYDPAPIELPETDELFAHPTGFFQRERFEIGTEVIATREIVRDFGWTGRHRVPAGSRGIVEMVQEGILRRLMTVTWELGFTTHQVSSDHVRTSAEQPILKKKSFVVLLS